MDIQNHTLCAIKVIERDQNDLEKNKKQLKTFVKVIKFLNSVDHPNIVKLRGYIVSNNSLALITDFYE